MSEFNLSFDHVKASIERHAAANNITLIYGDDLRRKAVIRTMSIVHSILGTGWSYEKALQDVSVTLPGAGFAATLLTQIPFVGALLELISKELAQPTIFFSPTSMRDGIALLATYIHEIGHVGSIRSGGAFWCLAYGLFADIRVAAEAPCYGASACVEHAFRGSDLTWLEEVSVESLAAYGLGPKDLAFARTIVHSNIVSLRKGGDPGGVIQEAKDILMAA